MLRGNARRRDWKIEGPHFLGNEANHLVSDPRDRKTWLLAAKTGHLGPTVFRSTDGGRPAVFGSRNGGRSWVRQSTGFPERHGWFTVFRQAMTCDAQDPVGLYLGNTTGEIWVSGDEGASWRQAASHLPQVLAIAALER